MIDLATVFVPDGDPAIGPALWAGSDVRELTGRAGAVPLDGPLGLLPLMESLARRLGSLSAAIGREVTVDGPSLLVERARITGHRRQGALSVGGACRLLRAADGWVAVSLARDEDRAAVPAWLQGEVNGNSDHEIAAAVAVSDCASLVEQAALLGIPCGALGEVTHGTIPVTPLGGAGNGPPRVLPSLEELVVVDLSSLWAGPLCGRLLADVGATVIKVESTSRPDGARRGPRAFFELMNAGKRSVMVDLATSGGRAELAQLIASADVVIEASRPRALQQLGIDADAFPGRVWLSITAYGRSQPMRVGFGDDCAVAGGLVAHDAEGPVFVGDAAADPITGLLGAVAVLDRLASGERCLVDLGLAQAARLATAAG